MKASYTVEITNEIVLRNAGYSKPATTPRVEWCDMVTVKSFHPIYHKTPKKDALEFAKRVKRWTPSNRVFVVGHFTGIRKSIIEVK